MLHVLNDWFGWPNGSVLTNLVATAIGVVLGYFVAVRRHVKALHQKLDSLHEKQDRLHAHLNVKPKHHPYRAN